MNFYTHNNLRHYFFDQGEGEVVLLLHGITNSGRAFMHQVVALINAGYRVIIPDHAGHGASDNIDAKYTVDDLAADTFALIENLALTNINIVGVSLGGMVSLQLLVDHPSRFNKAIIANSFAETANSGFAAMGETWRSEFLSQHGAVKRFENSWSKLVNSAFRSSAEGAMVYQNWHAQAASADGASLANIVDGITGFDISKLLHKIHHPVLVISGESDVISPASNSTYLAKNLPNAQHICIENASHLPNVDSAIEFNTLLLNFLGQFSSKIRPHSKA